MSNKREEIPLLSDEKDNINHELINDDIKIDDSINGVSINGDGMSDKSFQELSSMYLQKPRRESIEIQIQKGKINKNEAATKLKKDYSTNAHKLNKIQLLKQYKLISFEDGMTSEQIEQSFQLYGKNDLTEKKETPIYVKLFLAIFTGFFNILLWIGSLLCVISFLIDYSEDEIEQEMSVLYFGIILAVVVILSGLFTFYQENKSSNLMNELSKMRSENVSVIRNTKEITITPSDLVPGDVILLKLGDYVPADIRIFECSNDFTVDNSSLTGESEPLLRSSKPSNNIPRESDNLLFFGTLIVNGSGRGIVIKTGDETFIGRTAQLATFTEGETTPIAKEIKNFVFKISVIAFILGITFFIVGMAKDGHLVKNINFLIGIIISNVPHGLLPMITLSLSLTAMKMYKKNVKVKHLESVETLGSTNVICSDKTGTLTTNIMTTQHVYYDLTECVCDTDNPTNSINGDFYVENKNKNTKPQRKESFLKLIRCGTLCNNAVINTDDDDGSFKHTNVTVNVNANPTEAAIIKFNYGHIKDEYKESTNNYKNQYKILYEIPFNSKNKWHLTIVKLEPNNAINDEINTASALVLIKGAPERIINFCSKYIKDGKTLNMTDKIKNQINDSMKNFGKQGERVLGFAQMILDPDTYDVNTDEPDDFDKNIYNKKYDTTCEQTPNVNNSVIVDYNGTKYTIEMKNELRSSKIEDVLVGLSSKIGVRKEKIRLVYDDKGLLSPNDALSDVGIINGSLLYCFIGRYQFYGTNTQDINIAFNEFSFLGLYGMIDPPRPGVPLAVSKCMQAGIKVIMITGDHWITAKAIALKIGILKSEEGTLNYSSNNHPNLLNHDGVIIAGSELQTVLDKEANAPQYVASFWNDILSKKYIVFARTSPQQKLLIVSAIQQRNGICAVTGDGVNDAPALKKADIGVSMGITGTAVAKEAADMILLDDDFSSIVNGIEEGRIIFDNLKKSIAYTLVSNIPEILPFLAHQLFGVPLALATGMILLVDLGTDMAPSISYAYEPKESDIMKRKPRDPIKDHLVTWALISFSYLQIGMLTGIAGFYSYFVVCNSFGLTANMLFGLDKDLNFGFEKNKYVDSRDSYWLWCFYNDECIYLPDFGNPIDYPNVGDYPYYNQEQFNGWLNNDDTHKTYKIKAKEYIVERYPDVGLKHCNLDAGCTTKLSYQEFITNYWPKLFNEMSDDLRRDNLNPSRRCWNEDYYSTYCEENGIIGGCENHDIQYCNTTDINPDARVYPYTNEGERSLFPMAMRDRTEILALANTAYFVSIVVTQIADLMICKTRIVSFFEHGMGNGFMNYSILFEISLAAFIVYIPFSNELSGTRPIDFIYWMPGVPFMILIFIYEELRKGWVRKHNKGWIARNTFW